MTRVDRFWVGVAQYALRRMSNRAAWQFFSVLREAYRQRPDLAGEDEHDLYR